MIKVKVLSNFFFVFLEPPDRPENVIATHVESRNVVISWTTPYSGNIMISAFYIEYKTTSMSWDSNEKLIETTSGNVNSIILQKLIPMTSYQVRIKCENSLGSSEYSDVINFTTQEKGKVPI